MKILNLYAGIGGNRRLWDGHEITAVEIRPDIAAVYADNFPNDNVVIEDAHGFLLDHYSEFDFIWSSPPCQSHSRAPYWAYRNKPDIKKRYPDASLYQEITFLDRYFDGLYSVENVVPYYEPWVQPSVKLGRHLFWANFPIYKIDCVDADLNQYGIKELQKFHNFDLSGYRLVTRADDLLRNCVSAETGEHILKCAQGKYKSKSSQISIF
jgi:DNA (cytosine-5)-methyltransferase 1